MSLYLDQRFEDEMQVYKNIMVTDEEDHTAQFFMDKALQYLRNGEPENWTGAEEMLHK